MSHNQYKARATAVHQIIGHISIGISAAFFILAVFFSSAQSVLQSKWAPNAPDYTWTEKPPIYTPRGHRIYFSIGYTNILGLWLIKTAFLSMYFEITISKPKIRKILWAVCAYTAATCVLTFLTHTFWCHPISRNWAVLNHCSTWLSIEAMTIVFFANITTDLGMGVHLDKSLDLNYNESDSGMMSTYKAYGYMHRMEKIKMWALLEWCMATTAFCLPSLRSSLKTKSKQKGVEEISSTGLETYISTVEGRVDRQN
ncbi:hypothetical protein FPQ18DRAFT_300983 [Pyronema domesticum]|nr:hypothetical protein FPQ18DRAFT_300983 [Pyronema domesticum]